MGPISPVSSLVADARVLGGSQSSDTQEQKDVYRDKPESLQAYRKSIESNLNTQFKMVKYPHL